MARYNTFVPRFTEAVPAFCFRELYACIELNITDTSTSSALRLVDHLICTRENEKLPIKAEDLVIADRDRLLAAIHNVAYGPRIESAIKCLYCGLSIQIDFDLSAFEQHLYTYNEPVSIVKLEGDRFEAAGGYQFRLPTGRDELATSELPEEKAIDALLERCVMKRPMVFDDKFVQNAMEQAAPILESDMEIICPECERNQTVHFNIQEFLLGRLIRAQDQVIREIHCIATAYHWSYEDIMNLPCSLRKKYAELIDL
jgi:hypothetical protein